MTKKELLKQLHNLNQEIKPDAEWKASNRDILMSQIKAQTTVAKIEHASIFNGLMFKKFIAAAYRPVAAMVLIVGIVLGGYTMTVSATKNSLPGDFLYPIKLTGERMKVNLAGNDEKKANLEIEFAQKRLDEMQKVADNSGSDSDKKENMQVSLQKYQESINNVKTSLSKLEKTDSATALKVAKMVDDKTQNYVEILIDQQAKSPEITKAADTTDAISASKSMAEKALDVIINEYKAGSREVTLETVVQSLQNKLTDLNNGLEKDGQDLDKIIVNMALAKELEAKQVAEAAKVAAEAVKLAETTGTAPTETTAETIAETNQNTNTNDNANINAPVQEPTPIEAPVPAPVEVLPIPEVAKSRLVEIRSLLAQANGYLSTKEVFLSYARMKDAQDLMVLIDKVIEANKQYLEEPKAETPEPAKEEQAPADTNGNTNAVL
jgi:hypothetical protein